MARADNTGLRVRATLSAATGPKIQVTGANTTPRASIPVLATRLMPTGWKSAVV